MGGCYLPITTPLWFYFLGIRRRCSRRVISSIFSPETTKEALLPFTTCSYRPGWVIVYSRVVSRMTGTKQINHSPPTMAAATRIFLTHTSIASIASVLIITCPPFKVKLKRLIKAPFKMKMNGSLINH